MTQQIYTFDERLAFSVGVVAGTCTDTIRQMLPGCVSVTKAKLSDDLNGIDYWAELRRGAMVGIDHKARERGCSRFWRHGEPELGLEVWSVMPDEDHIGKAGWTLSESKITDYTLHTFSPDDTKTCYLLPFQLLRVSFRNHMSEWKDIFGVPTAQNSGTWKSLCLFIPASVVLNAIRETMSYIKEPNK